MRTQQPKSLRPGERSPEGEFLVLQPCLKKQEKSQINNLTLHLKELKKKGGTTDEAPSE